MSVFNNIAMYILKIDCVENGVIRVQVLYFLLGV